ncbi:hypothetical protein BH24ACI1_BH24ACI1_11450 [soil metagenome]
MEIILTLVGGLVLFLYGVTNLSACKTYAANKPQGKSECRGENSRILRPTQHRNSHGKFQDVAN